MAKSTNDAINAFNKFNDILEKKVKTKVTLMGFSDIDDYIPTGNYLLNAQISGSVFGGYPNTRSIGIAGDSGAGKTFLCLNAVRELQKKDYFVFYIDTEGAIDRSDYIKFGVDLEKLKYLRMGLISDVKFFINDFIETMRDNPGLKAAIFVDSVGMLDTDKSKRDMDAGKNASDMGLRSKEMRSLFKSFTLELSNLKVPFIFTNHTYASMDQYTPKGMSGGGGPEFSASIILMLSKGTLRDEAKTTTGIIVRSKTRKNRLAKPIDIEFHISFHKGMNQYVGLEQFVNWENCGVGRGNKLTEKEFSKLKLDEQSICSEFEVGGEKFYFLPKKLGKSYVIRHNGDLVPVKEFFTGRLFTHDVLMELDEKVIKPTFKFPETQDEIDLLENSELNDLNDDDDESTF
jgi:recombination protein RecA